jgi:aminopeptidase N
MRHLLTLLMSVFLPVLLCAQEDPLQFTRNLSAAEARSAARFLQPAYDQSGSPLSFTRASQTIDVHHYRLNLRTDPAVRYITGDVTVSFTTRASINQVILDLVDSLTVDSVIWHGVAAGHHRPGDHSVVIDLPSDISSGALDSFTVYYQGPPPAGSGFGSYAVATQHGIPVMWTLSEPYGSREWWPCKNGLDDKADSIDVLITTPIAYTSVSNGLLSGEDSTAQTRTTWWKHRYPIASYLVAISATNFSISTDTVLLGNTVMPLMQHCYPGSEQYYHDAFPRTKDALRWYSSWFGEYPFIRERYGHTQFGWSGGMEHQTNSFMNNLNGGMVYHEMAHQWFGDKITCGSWQHIWLNEGFATLGTYLMYEHEYSADFNITIRKSIIDYIASKPDGSVFVDDTSSVDRVFDTRLTYNKGFMLLRMLRGILGDDAFFRALKSYQQDPTLAYGYALTSDLQKHFEQEGGVSLNEFFKDWFYGQGYPSYHLQWQPAGGKWTMIDLSQTTSHASVNFFEMPVPLKFISGAQSKTVIVDHRTNHQRLYLDLGFIPDSVVIDPEIWLISSGNTVVRMPDNTAGSPEILAYPNPMGPQVQVWLRRVPNGHTSLALHDAIGRLLWKREWDVSNGGDYLTIPTDRLPRGIYELTLRQGRGVLAFKKMVK